MIISARKKSGPRPENPLDTEIKLRIDKQCLFDIGLVADRETEVAYQQGLKDFVWILKNIEVLA